MASRITRCNTPAFIPLDWKIDKKKMSPKT